MTSHTSNTSGVAPSLTLMACKWPHSSGKRGWPSSLSLCSETLALYATLSFCVMLKPGEEMIASARRLRRWRVNREGFSPLLSCFCNRHTIFKPASHNMSLCLTVMYSDMFQGNFLIVLIMHSYARSGHCLANAGCLKIMLVMGISM